MDGKLYVKRLVDGETIREIPVSASSTRHLERVLSGLLATMDTGAFYVDDSEFDALYGYEGGGDGAAG